MYNPPNATPIIVDKISEEEYMQQVKKLRDRRQSLQVKHAYRLRNDSKRALKVRDTEEGCFFGGGVPRMGRCREDLGEEDQEAVTAGQACMQARE